jgi:hypothetical protein
MSEFLNVLVGMHGSLSTFVLFRYPLGLPDHEDVGTIHHRIFGTVKNPRRFYVLSVPLCEPQNIELNIVQIRTLLIK